MGVSRETVFRALFALTDGVTWNPDPDSATVQGFKTRERRLRLFSDVNAKDQPYVCQTEHGEQSAQTTRLPYKRIWEANWVVYHRAADNPGVEPVVLTNQIIDALEAAIAPKPSDPGFLDQRNTLSGLVHHCYIEGTVFKDPGDIDKQALIIVPIKLLVP